MTELLTAADMRAIEAAAIDSGSVTGFDLMERAGCGVVEAILDEWPDAQSASILCGPGNNGGDGYVIARLLHERGWDVAVWSYGNVEGLPQDARAMYALWTLLGPVRPLDQAAFRRGPPRDVYVDALFGTGLSRPAHGALADFLRYLGGSGGDREFYASRMIAIDAPSGLCLDSGRILGTTGRESFAACPFATVTVTFDSPKVGHFLADGPERCGRLVIKDIGISGWRTGFGLEAQEQKRAVRRPEVCLVTRTPLVPDERHAFMGFPADAIGKRQGHKFDHGHCFVLSGGVGRGGAARLAARAALRVGAGLVTLLCPPSALMENAMRLDAIMTQSLAGPEALEEALSDPRIAALCIGPGLGHDRARALVPVALVPRCGLGGSANAMGPALVLDADALSAFEGSPEDLFDRLHPGVVLTPHFGEFRRLFPDLAERWAEVPNTGPATSKVDVAQAAAKRAGCTILLKGADTVISTETGRAAVHAASYDRKVPWLATAGAGDVLAGLITGLLARGYPAYDAARYASWLHVEAALAFGPGLIAEDLPETLPKVFRDLGV